MENLAEVQGGSGSGESSPASPAHAQSDQNKLEKFMARGEEILDTFAQSIRAFESQSLHIKSLTESVAEIKQTIGGKRASDAPGNSNSAKVARCLATEENESREGAGHIEEDDVDEILNAGESSDDQGFEGEFFQDVSDFFMEESEIGEPISERVANLVDKSVRGQTDEVKLKLLKDKYKRPSNVDNLQVPKVDRVVWEQLKWQTKANDAVRQKSVQRLYEGIMPMVLAMDHLANNKSVDMGLLKGYIGDTFKILCNNVIKTNTERREQIKKEVSPKYKAVCDNPASATGLFGDTLTEEIKKIDTRPVKLTTKTPFLGKPGAAGPSHQHQRYQPFRRPQSHFNQRPRNPPNQSNFSRGGKHSVKSGIIKKKWEK